MKLQVRSVTGQTLELEDIDETQDIAYLKVCIEEQHSIPAQFQRIIFSGKELNNDETLEHHDIKDGSIIQLAVRHTQQPDTDGAGDDNNSSINHDSASNHPGQPCKCVCVCVYVCVVDTN